MKKEVEIKKNTIGDWEAFVDFEQMNNVSSIKH